MHLRWEKVLGSIVCVREGVWAVHVCYPVPSSHLSAMYTNPTHHEVHEAPTHLHESANFVCKNKL